MTKTYRTIAVIPARSGSKGIPEKNIKKLGQIPLIGYTIEAALLANTNYADEDLSDFAHAIDLCVLTSNSDEILETGTQIAKRYDPDLERWMTIKRPEYLAMDHVQVDEVMLHVVRELEHRGIRGENLIILQPTSPFRTYIDVADAVRMFKGSGSLIGVYPVDGYYWDWSMPDGEMSPLGHDPSRRLGRQWDYGENYIVRENGAMYVLNFEDFSLYKQSKIAPFTAFHMTKESSLDLDTMTDWEEAEKLIEKYTFAGKQNGNI